MKKYSGLFLTAMLRGSIGSGQCNNSFNIIYIYFIRREIYNLHHIEQKQLLLCMSVQCKCMLIVCVTKKRMT